MLFFIFLLETFCFSVSGMFSIAKGIHKIKSSIAAKKEAVKESLSKTKNSFMEAVNRKKDAFVNAVGEKKQQMTDFATRMQNAAIRRDTASKALI